MEPESSVIFTQHSATDPYWEGDEPSPQSTTLFLLVRFCIILSSSLKILLDLSPRGVRPKYVTCF